MKTIKFLSGIENLDLLTESPKPSKNFIPEWYKKVENFFRLKPEFDNEGYPTNTNIKMCMPFFDALTVGYIQKTWCDIYIQKDSSGEVTYNYSNGPQIMAFRTKPSLEIPDNYYNIEFIWKNYWSYGLPSNYSVLVTHPLNRLDLPFTTLSGIIDNSEIQLTTSPKGGNLPFYLKKNFEGLIPAGTPIFQIIPFKRENWTSETPSFDEKTLVSSYAKRRSKFWGYYKDNIWNKKSYS